MSKKIIDFPENEPKPDTDSDSLMDEDSEAEVVNVEEPRKNIALKIKKMQRGGLIPVLPSIEPENLDLDPRTGELKIEIELPFDYQSEKDEFEEKLANKIDFIDSVTIKNEENLREETIAEKVDDILQKNQVSIPVDRDIDIEKDENGRLIVKIEADFGFGGISINKKKIEQQIKREININTSEFRVESVEIIN
ncbi:MAG: hypothetical protein ABEJ02_00980 [Candidatus Paceibacteria bacterium]